MVLYQSTLDMAPYKLVNVFEMLDHVCVPRFLRFGPFYCGLHHYDHYNYAPLLDFVINYFVRFQIDHYDDYFFPRPVYCFQPSSIAVQI